jgi:hypothetical protein
MYIYPYEGYPLNNGGTENEDLSEFLSEEAIK